MIPPRAEFVPMRRSYSTCVRRRLY
jgi:hypothetical protein